MALTLDFDKNKYKDVRPEWMFFIYFSVMLCLYTHTYIQLGIQLLIIAYVVIKKFGTLRLRMSIENLKSIVFLVIWAGGLTLLMYASKYWAVASLADSNTVLTMFRIFAIGLTLFLYVDSAEKALSVLQSLALAAFVMSIVVLLTTPVSEYFQAGDEGFGSKIGQHRNQVGCLDSAMAIVCIYLKRYTNYQYGYYLSFFFIVVTLLSGSRGSLIQMIIVFVLIISMDNNLFRMIFKLSLLAFLGCTVIIIIKNIPILYENIWLRFDSMFTTLSGEEVTDTSTMGREFYKEIAFEMFKQKPLLGWGVDGFVTYLFNNPYYKGYYIAPVYSHCNFTELAACFGIVGLLIWYVPTFSMLIRSFKNLRKSPLIEMTSYLLFSMIILDYGRIPWSSHLGMYIYFAVFLVIYWVTNDIKSEKKNISVNDIS